MSVEGKLVKFWEEENYGNFDKEFWIINFYSLLNYFLTKLLANHVDKKYWQRMLTKNGKKIKKTFFKPPGMQMTSISASRLYERSTWEPFCLTLRWEVFFRTSLTVKLFILLCCCKICIFIHNFIQELFSESNKGQKYL